MWMDGWMIGLGEGGGRGVVLWGFRAEVEVERIRDSFTNETIDDEVLGSDVCTTRKIS